MRRSRWSVLRLCSLAIVCVCLAGCFDTKQEVSLNPDGSGKVVMESTFTQVELLLKEYQPTPHGNAATERVRKLIEDAKGVDAWRDISFRELEDGRLWVRGTAYFRDMSKVKTSLNSLLNFKWTETAGGELTLELQPDTSQSPFRIANTKTNVPDTPESIQYERKQFRAAKPMMDASIGTMKLQTIFHFPGVVKSSSNFQTNGPRTLRFSLDGRRVVTASERILFDQQLTQQRLAASPLTNLLTPEFVNEQVFGQRAPVRAVIVTDQKPLFDYATEVAEARKSFPAMAKALGLAEPSVERAKPAVDGAPARIQVTGVEWRFGQPAKPYLDGLLHRYTLSLNAELPGAVFSVDEVLVTRVVTLEGVLLESKQRQYRGTSFRHELAGQTNVSFDVALDSPPADSKGLAEISGVLECTSAENLRTVELISGRLGAGAKGAEFGAHVEHVGANDSGTEKLVLSTSLEPCQLRSLYVVNDAGMKVNLDIRGTMNVGKEYSYTCAARHWIPRSGKLVADVLVGSQTLRIPFSVTNLTLLGQPLAAIEK